jgi:TusA-related sulfurtransferase
MAGDRSPENPRILDLLGVRCPLNWARAKAVLETMPAGEALTIVTDDARALRDIPAAAEMEGWSVLEVEARDAVARITIEK